MHISLFEEGSKGERAEESLRFTFTIITSYKHLFLREREREREMKTWREIARERDRNIRAAKA
jgi:hypothetical protein